MSAVTDDLPDEVLAVILSRFDLLEKLKLRAVCLRWKFIIESFRIKDVSIVDRYFNRSKFPNNFGTEFVNCQSLIYSNQSSYRWLIGAIRPPMPNSLQFVRDNPMFAGLKSMFLSFESINNFSFEKYINPHFPHLEQLSCFRLILGKTCLSLANLKVLSLYPFHHGRSVWIRLDLPSMYQLRTNLRLNSFEFVHPQTVTHLLLFDDHESITRFSNLEYLSCYQLDYTVDIFSNLTKLKEIHLEYRENDGRMAEIYSIKERLGRHDLKMFVHGVDYRTYRDHPTLPVKDALRSLLSMDSSPFPQISTVIYQDLFDGRPIPSALKSRLSIVRHVMAFKIPRSSIDSFFSFLNDCPNLFTLDLTETFDERSDRQACYDRLPSHCQFIRELKLSSFVRPSICLNFVLGFLYLQKLKLSHIYIWPDIITSLFEKLKYFQVLDVLSAIEGHQIKITKQEHLIERNFILSLNSGQEEATYSNYYNDFLDRKINRRKNFKTLLIQFQLLCARDLYAEANFMKERLDYLIEQKSRSKELAKKGEETRLQKEP